MHIISFSTEDTNWRSPRMGFILHVADRDTGYRLDCEKLFDAAERPKEPLAWFDMDGPWFQKARETHDLLVRDEKALAQARDSGWLVRSQDAYWHAPIPRPGKVICIGLNYRDHAAESNAELPAYPTVFAKYASCIIGPGAAIVIPRVTSQVDYEGELAVVIGRRARDVAEADALDYVAGYAPFNDVSARDYQMRTSQWTIGKTFDT